MVISISGPGIEARTGAMKRNGGGNDAVKPTNNTTPRTPTSRIAPKFRY